MVFCVRCACIYQTVRFLYLQLLNESLESIYDRYNCSELVKAEREKRASDQRTNAATARSRSIFFASARKEDDTGRLIVKVFKYIRTLNVFENVRGFIEEENIRMFNMNFKLSVVSDIENCNSRAPLQRRLNSSFLSKCADPHFRT